MFCIEKKKTSLMFPIIFHTYIYESGTFMYFLVDVKDKEWYRDEVLSIQKVKSFSIYLLWPETKMFILDVLRL